MKHARYRFIIICVIPILITVSPIIAFPEETKKETSKSDKVPPIEVIANTFEIDNKAFVITYTGNVEARRDDLIINCQEILIYYQNTGGSANPEKFKESIYKIIATGKVRISRPDKGTATAEKVVYTLDEEKIVLTGKPVIKQGNNLVEGPKIILFLKENRYIVEGSEDSKSRAVLYP